MVEPPLISSHTLRTSCAAMLAQALGSTLRADGTGTRLPGVHNYHALTHKNARFLPTRPSLLPSAVPLGRSRRATATPETPYYQKASHSRVRPLFPALKDRRGAPVRADPPLRDPAFLPFPRTAPSGHHAPLLLDRDAVSIFEYPCVVTAMTSLRITGESRA